MQESMQYDVVIVGAGPAGLSAAIRLKQQAQKNNKNIDICILEKGSEIGAHQLSGAVLDPSSLQELLGEDWQKAPLDTAVTKDRFYVLTEKKFVTLPTPSTMHNEGNYIISLGALSKYLSTIAESMGCEIYPGFAANKILYNESGEVVGVSTGEFGIDKDGNKTQNYQPPMQLLGRQTFISEGCRGQLAQSLIQRFALNKASNPQTYAIGIKEVWKVKDSVHKPGTVVHTVGWPLDRNTYGGSFVYHWSKNRVSIGMVIGLDYANPWMSPFQELQRFKHHPMFSSLLDGAERISYGSRALNEGGWQSLPKLSFPGGLLLGCAAGMVNVAKIKGIHNAIRSGIEAADCYFSAHIQDNDNTVAQIESYDKRIKQGPIGQELKAVRNIRAGFRYGLWFGLLNASFEAYISRGCSPWTLHNHADHTQIKHADNYPPINYPSPDGIISFDRTSSIFLSNVYHEENQPCHLVLRNNEVPITKNYHEYQSPETRYCPAGVYEIIEAEGQAPRLQINAQNCIHCKTCDIKDPTQNIHWVAPEGGGGPNYSEM